MAKSKTVYVVVNGGGVMALLKQGQGGAYPDTPRDGILYCGGDRHVGTAFDSLAKAQAARQRTLDYAKVSRLDWGEPHEFQICKVKMQHP